MIKRLLGRHSDFFFALLRIVAAIMFLLHGLQKFNIPALHGFVPPNGMLEAAKWIETIGAPFIIIGLATRWVAIILAGEMLVAYVTTHAPRSPFPLVNGGEITVLYLFLFLYLAARGPGRLSADAVIGRDR